MDYRQQPHRACAVIIIIIITIIIIIIIYRVHNIMYSHFNPEGWWSVHGRALYIVEHIVLLISRPFSHVCVCVCVCVCTTTVVNTHDPVNAYYMNIGGLQAVSERLDTWLGVNRVGLEAVLDVLN